ncbi:MAG: hypothetical protein IPL58_09160 [Betaproteobacteria bacterium]|uniref:Uncharacterized protein n=1 Tax=Candidatus Proximibacter danicus TaxID=2954365 RepID=A0A9D7K0P2_9PROT|nr:hypothetical protein [Candidatus Proximibacter danicus]
MNDATNTCNACFPPGSQPNCRVFDHSSGAVTIYSSLHAIGESPSMCMQSDNRYRVCHIKASVTKKAALWVRPLGLLQA